MNTKRFSQKDEDDWEILDRNKHFAYAHSGYQAKKIIETLNKLYDKLDCHILLTDQERQKASNFIKGIEKENEELKQKIKSINEILNEDIGYIESLRKIEEVLK